MKTHPITEDEIHILLDSTKTILDSFKANPMPDNHRKYFGQALKAIYSTLDTVTDKELAV